MQYNFMSTPATKKYSLDVTIDPNMPDLSKDPYFVKKAEKARAFIAKHGLPKDDKPAKKGK
jgi:hypothetical protein